MTSMFVDISQISNQTCESGLTDGCNTKIIRVVHWDASLFEDLTAGFRSGIIWSASWEVEWTQKVTTTTTTKCWDKDETQTHTVHAVDVFNPQDESAGCGSKGMINNIGINRYHRWSCFFSLFFFPRVVPRTRIRRSLNIYPKNKTHDIVQYKQLIGPTVKYNQTHAAAAAEDIKNIPGLQPSGTRRCFSVTWTTLFLWTDQVLQSVWWPAGVTGCWHVVVVVTPPPGFHTLVSSPHTITSNTVIKTCVSTRREPAKYENRS